MHSGVWVKAGRRAALLLLAFLVSAFAAELALRRVPSSLLGYEYEAGVFRGPREFVEDTTSNAWGFHDVEHGGKRAGSQRVLLLGDSYVAAMSMPLEATPAQRLERELRARTGGDVEVVALGRPGWGQREELRALKRFGAEIAPDVVLLLALTFNDLSDNSPELDRLADEQLQRIAATRPGWTRVPADRAPLFFFRDSALNRLISQRLALLLRKPEGEIPLNYEVYLTPPLPRWEAAWHATEMLLGGIETASERLGAKLVVAAASTPHGARGAAGLAMLLDAYPAMRGKQWDLGQPDRWLGDYCRTKSIPFLALEPVFRDRTAAGETLHWKSDGHWNRRGNELAGAELAKLVAPTLPPRPLTASH